MCCQNHQTCKRSLFHNFIYHAYFSCKQDSSGCSTTASAHTVFSQASAKGLAQLKHQKLRVGDCTEVVLKCCICARKWTDHSLVAKLLQCLLLALHTNLSCKWGVLRTRLQMGVCEPLQPDFMASEQHQNNCSCVHELSTVHCARI